MGGRGGGGWQGHTAGLDAVAKGTLVFSNFPATLLTDILQLYGTSFSCIQVHFTLQQIRERLGSFGTKIRN